MEIFFVLEELKKRFVMSSKYGSLLRLMWQLNPDYGLFTGLNIVERMFDNAAAGSKQNRPCSL